MALTTTVLLATFAVFDSMAVPLNGDNTTDISSTFTSAATSSWITDTLGSATVATTSGSAVSVTDAQQSSVSASPTDSQSSFSSVFSSTTENSATTTVSAAYTSALTVTVTAPPQTVTDTITIVPPPTPAPTLVQTVWSAPSQMTDLSAFNIQNFAYGHQNMRIIVDPSSIPQDASNDTTSAESTDPDALFQVRLAIASAADAGMIPPPPAANASAFLQLFYPANSINPAQEPQGGADFYAAPLDFSGARNVSLEYSVFFPADFDWVQAGKLPGVYGGHDGCSGGDDALECFSTRLMWRSKGLGELYLYAPKDKQTAALCDTPPTSVCDAEWGLSIARGAFSFALGNWTHVRQTVTLNTPGKQDGGFALDVNGQRVIERCDVYYRGEPKAAAAAADPDSESAVPAIVPAQAPAPPALPSPAPAGGVQDFVKSPFKLKVDSVLSDANANVSAREFAPALVPSAPFAPYADSSGDGTGAVNGTADEFTPSFAPPVAPAPEGAPPPNVKVADPLAASSLSTSTTPPPSLALASTTAASTSMTTSTGTVAPETQTITVYPTSTETSYVVALETGTSSATFAALATPDDGDGDGDNDGEGDDDDDDDNDNDADNDAPAAPIGFTGLFFSTFFGGHEPKYATPRDQFTWFKEFAMTING
ncbi:hypothetical protein BC628DRAFT_1420647 [Trametes gibbosa]|nr:hypothetical protein BC628DRAFT_1420647 [Trametes gibbosa]